MGATKLDAESCRRLVIDTLLRPDFRRATFGGTARRAEPSPWLRVVVRPVELRGRHHLQFEYFDAKKCIAKNFQGAEIQARIAEVLDVGFAGIHLTTLAEELDIRTTKRGKIIPGRRKLESPSSQPLRPHNRVKDVPLPEGRAAAVLEALGISTRDGQVRPTMRAKYTQVNEFLKQLLHVLDDAGLRSLGRAVQILDCGCGSSYLTLSTYFYLNDVLGIPARIMGVDVNEEVIRKSIDRAGRLGAEGISFACASIEGIDAKPDIVIALHACDTATDEAIARAVSSEARILLSVPCCHHELNKALGAEGPASVLRPMLRHGILRERTADLVTDAFRALALRIMGYRTDVVEFVSTEHTARNLMIRAVRGAPVGEAASVSEYREMRRFWGVTPYIETVLGEAFHGILSKSP